MTVSCLLTQKWIVGLLTAGFLISAHTSASAKLCSDKSQGTITGIVKAAGFNVNQVFVEKVTPCFVAILDVPLLKDKYGRYPKHLGSCQRGAKFTAVGAVKMVGEGFMAMPVMDVTELTCNP